MECVHWARAARVAWMNLFALLLSGMSLCMKARVEIVNMPISMAVTRAFCSFFGTGASSGSVFVLFFVLADRRGCGLSVGGTMVEFVSRGRTCSCWLCWGGSARVFRRFVGLFAGSVGVSVVVIGIGGVVRLAYSEVLVSVVSLSRGNLCVWFGRGWSSRCRFGV